MFNPKNEFILYDATLMYQDKKVMDFKFSIYCFHFYIEEITKIYDENLIPIFMKEDQRFNEWYTFRCFSNSTPKYDDIIYCLSGMPDFIFNRLYGVQKAVSLFSYGANLTDKYWINPAYPITFYSDIEDEGYLDGKIIYPSTYDKVSFFTNPNVSEDFGNAFMQYHEPKIKITDFRTPDICTEGHRKKRWILKNNEYIFQKLTFDNDERQAFFQTMKDINPHIIPEFSIKKIDLLGFAERQDVIETKCFTSNNTELITAYDIASSETKKVNSVMELFKENYLTLGGDIENFNELKEALDEYKKIKGIEIRHYENFGFIRDCDTKKIIKPIIWSLP